jgi:hypothetical protein
VGVVLDVRDAPVAEVVGRLGHLDEPGQHVLIGAVVAADGAQRAHPVLRAE